MAEFQKTVYKGYDLCASPDGTKRILYGYSAISLKVKP